MNTRWMLAALFVVLGMGSAQAEEVQITLEWGGSGTGCDVCGDADYACSGPYGDWNDGQANFVDPLPTGAILTGVTATLQGVSEDGTVTLWLSGNQVGDTQMVAGPFDCGACSPTVYQQAGSFSAYSYGGSNTLWIDTSSDPETCVNRVDLTLEYSLGGDDDDATGDDDDATGDDDDVADDDDSAGDDDDDDGGRGGGRRRAGCSVAAGGVSAAAIAGMIAVIGRRRRT